MRVLFGVRVPIGHLREGTDGVSCNTRRREAQTLTMGLLSRSERDTLTVTGISKPVKSSEVYTNLRSAMFTDLVTPSGCRLSATHCNVQSTP